METIQSHPEKFQFTQEAKQTVDHRSSSVSRPAFWQMLEENRFAITPLLLVVIACIGGVAASYVLDQHVLKLALVALSVAFVEASVLAVMPMRTVFVATVIALLLCTLVMVF